jgi:hypothetical protein
MKTARHQDLQPFTLAVQACRRVWSQRDELLRLGIVPLVLTFLLNLWSWPMLAQLFAAVEAGKPLDPAVAESMTMPLLFAGILSWFLSGIFAVNWMRAMIMGPSSIRGLGMMIQRRHIKFVLYVIGAQIVLIFAILVILVVMALLLPGSAMIALLAFVLMGAYLTILLKLTPIWVGIAIDAPMSLKQAWSRTAGSGLKLAVSVILLSGLLFVAQSIVQVIFGVIGLLAAAPLATIFIFLFMQFILTACVSTVLVIAYPRFVSETV